jgi:hypothetical protein
MKNQLNEIKRMQQLAGLLNESQLEEAVDTLDIQKDTSKEGNTQITLSVLGGGFKDNQLTISVEEAKELHKLAKEFAGNRNSGLSKGVNTKDDNFTQSTISIKPDGLKCIIARQEGSVYRGYGKEVEANAGYLVAQQSIVYQLVDELEKNLNEAPATNTPSDVAALGRAQASATTVANKSKNINSIQEFPGAFEVWFQSLGFEPGKISKSAVRSQVEQVLTKLGYK